MFNIYHIYKQNKTVYYYEYLKLKSGKRTHS